MLRKRLAKTAKVVAVVIIIALALIAAVGRFAALYVSTHMKHPIYSRTEDVPAGLTAIVLGAGLFPDGTPNRQLRERLDAAITLYKSGKTPRLIVSGNSETKRGDEPVQMRDYLIARGIPARAIVVDPYGVRTYESVYRAVNVYGLKKALIVTHRYHLFRSLYLADNLGIDAVGFSADNPGESYWRSEIREQFSCVRAIIDLHIIRPNPNRKDSPSPVMN